MGVALSARRESGVDKANLITALRMRNYEQPPRSALTYQEPAVFAHGVVRIRNRDGEGVAEGRGRFLEGDAMLTKVRRRFVAVPHEAKHAANVQRLRTRRPCLTDRA